jgi:hypothetical protein
MLTTGFVVEAMRSQVAGHVLVGCLGCVVGWVAHSTLYQADEQTLTSSVEPAKRAMPTRSAEPDGSTMSQSTTRHARAQSGGLQSASVRSNTNTNIGKNSDLPDSSTFVLAPDRSSDALAAPSSERRTSPARNAANEGPLATLVSSDAIWCRFDPGNGAWLKEEGISLYELAYQGGPISYDSIDLGTGTARMAGSQGATASQDGFLDVLVTATRSGLHFSAFNPRGELVVTTVFSAMDRQGRHFAVMTRHGTRAFDGSFQTYGSCDTGTPKSR